MIANILQYCRLEFTCDGTFLRMFEIAKNFNDYTVIIVVMNFCKNVSSAKIFPSKFSAIFTSIFQLL